MDRLGSTRTASTEVVIHDGRLHWPGRQEHVAQAGGPEPATVSWMETLRNVTVLVVVCLYLLFNWGFMQLRVPPTAGSGLPIGEMVLMMYLVTINYSGVLGRLSQTVAILPFMVWWTFGLGRAMFDFTQHGAWALRDAAHVLESLFLLVGFVFAGDPKSFDRFFGWLPKLLAISVIYGLLYPIRVEIWNLSPTIMSGSGYPAPILGSMANTPQLMIMAAIYLMLYRSDRLLANVVAVLIIGYTLAIFQARTLYLIMIAVFGFIVFYRRSTISNLSLLVILSGFLLALVALVGLHVEGRLGADFGPGFLVAHFLAIFGICDPSYPGVCSAAEGVDQRLEWWTKIYDSMIKDPFSLLLGLGYGLPLTDFHGASGAEVREPHNSYLSVIARTGIVGVICWTIMMAELLRRWHNTFMRCRLLRWREGENRLLVLMVFFICTWVLALGEDGFEKPYNIIPFYFFWGIVLRFSLLLERHQIGPAAERVEFDPYRP
jgi:O-antigen ligase